jgi:sirohydrochlorin cobaltochelatase
MIETAPPRDTPRSGLLVVGHGTRDPAGAQQLRQLAELVACRLPAAVVRAAFLELATPDIATGMRELAAERVTCVTAVPLMLLAAGHVKRDIPLLLDRAAQQAGLARVVQTSHLGVDQRLVALSAQRYREAVASSRWAAHPHAHRILLVGRGSRDASAWDEMEQFAAARRRLHPQTAIRVAYLAMAQPAFEQIAEQLARDPTPSPVVVQPHLLFRGDLLSQLRERVDGFRRRRPELEWRLTEPIGPSDSLASIVLERYWQAAAGQGWER